MAQKSIPPELSDAFYGFVEYVDIHKLSRCLRTQFIDYCHTLQDGISDSFEESLPQIILLFELFDAIEDHTPFKSKKE